MRSSIILLSLGLLTAAAPSHAEIRITQSRYENGHLIVRGQTAPNTAVTLDGRLTTKSDGGGHFAFDAGYRPDTCMSDITAGTEVYSAVIAGCFGEFAIEREGKARPATQ